MVGSTQRSPRRIRRVKRVKGYEMKISPPPNVIAYTGPLIQSTNDETTVLLYDSVDISTTASSVSLRFDNNPSAARNWTEYSTAWNNYRVLGIRFRYMPANTVNTTGISGVPGYHAIVHGTVAAPTTLAQAASVGVSRPWQSFKPFVRDWRMQEVAEATFGLCSAPATTSNTLILFNSTNTSQYFGAIMIEYLIQFKTHIQ
jgi:hypothetical protein